MGPENTMTAPDVLGKSRDIRFKEWGVFADRRITPQPKYIEGSDGSLAAEPFRLRTDSEGFIVTGNDLANPGALRKTVLLGDSFVESLFVHEEQRFPSILERRLNSGGNPAQVWNAGYSGATLLHSYNSFVNKVIPQAPYIERLLIFTAMSDVRTLSTKKSYWAKDKTHAPIVEDRNTSVPSDREPTTAEFKLLLQTFVRTARCFGVEPIIVATPFRSGFHGDDFMQRSHPTLEAYEAFQGRMLMINAAAAEVAAETEVKFIDAEKELAGRFDLFYDTLHLNSRGQEVMADLLFERLTETEGSAPGRQEGAQNESVRTRTGEENHPYYGVPVMKLNDVDEFYPTALDPARIYEAPIGKGMRLRFLVDPQPAADKVVRVGFHGAVPMKVSTDGPFFEPVQIYKSRPDPYILFADPTLTLDRGLRLSWYLGTAWIDPDDAMEKIVRKVMAATGASYMLAGGGSGGGFTAGRFAARFRNSIASIKIPQTDVFRWPVGALGPTLSRGWGWDQERTLKTAPTRFRLADVYGDPRWNRGNLVHIVQHAGDTEHIEQHLKPFLRELGASDDAHTALDGQITVSRPYVGNGHLPVPAKLWQAEDDIALARLKAARPKAPSEPPEPMFMKPEGLQVSEEQRARRSEHFAKHTPLSY